MKFFLALLACPALLAVPVPRRVRIDGRRFVLSATNATVVMSGPNIVVKGPPYLPSVSGTSICNDVTDNSCKATGTCKTCTTFNQADVDHIKAMGWNTIRLGIAWAGAQPKDEDSLDAEFLKRLHAILDLTDQAGLYVLLDNHGDMVGSAGCGNGVPMWLQQKAAGDLIGKPLVTEFPYSLVSELEVSKLKGYSYCGKNRTKWALYAGDPNYNLLNECCQHINGPNPMALGFTSISQKTMDYLINDGPGRRDFIRFWTLMANEVINHPSAVAVELLNEPMTVHRRNAYYTWRLTAEAINGIIPDMSVSLADTGELAYIPTWMKYLSEESYDIDSKTVAWIRSSSTLFYAWHWYGMPSSWRQARDNAKALGWEWNVPIFATKFMDCDLWDGLAHASISHTYWHYSCYCNTGPFFGNRSVPSETFGACILGWGGGDSSRCVKQSQSILV